MFNTTKKRKILNFFVASIMILGLTGCGSQSINQKNGNSMSSEMVMGDMTYDGMFVAGIDSVGSSSSTNSSIYLNDYNYSVPETAPSPVPEENITSEDSDELSSSEYVEQKIVYTANLDLETKNIEDAMITINNNIDSNEGYIESDNRYDWNSFDDLYTRRRAEMTIRIPTENFETFLNSVANENIIVTSLNKDRTDYSEMYYDKDSRINSLRIQESRLMDLLAKADSVDVMLDIEDRLTDVRYEIESLTKELKTIDSKVAYSTIYLYISEVERYTSPTKDPSNFIEELKEVLMDSFESFIDTSKEILFAIIYLAPYIFVFIVAISIIVITIKNKRKNKNKKVEKKSENSDSTK